MKKPQVNGFLLINKPEGPSSHDVVQMVRRCAKTRQVGHAGTLDPDASGLLGIAIGSCTKLLEFLVLKDKSYEFEIIFGTQTTTDDATGDIIASSDSSHLRQQDLEAILPTFIGRAVDQVPPNISAVRINRRRAYDLTREGVPFEMPTRQVDIYAIEIIDFSEENSTARMRLDCSSGTYVRALCRDLGLALGTHAHARGICRTSLGKFLLSQAVNVDSLEKGQFHEALLTEQQMLGANLTFTVPDELAWRLGMGQKVFVRTEPDFTEQDITEYVTILDEPGEVIGVGFVTRLVDGGAILQPKKILKPRWGTEKRDITGPEEPKNADSQA